MGNPARSRIPRPLKFAMQFLPGQVYLLPGFDREAIATVCHVDEDAFGAVVHVRIDGVSLPDPGAAEDGSPGIELIPFTSEALAGSVGQMIEQDIEITGWEPAYDAWRNAYEEGEATVWSLPVYDAVQVMQCLIL